MSELISRVESIEMKLLKSSPPQLLIIANGKVPTTGWNNPELLRPKMDAVNGIYQLDFFAQPPGDLAADAIIPISAYYLFSKIPEDFKGVKVMTSTNSLEQQFYSTESGIEKSNEFQYQLENLMGIEITEDKLKIKVSSGGCTDENSFKINVIKGFTGMPPYIVEVYRIIPDHCKKHIPEGVFLEYELSDLDIEPFATFKLENKIGKTIR